MFLIYYIRHKPNLLVVFMNLLYKKFKNIDLSDEFFDSLKKEYAEFIDWFNKKSEEQAYVFENDTGEIDGFLYLKVEDGVVADVNPPLPSAHRIKVGTFKINAHGTKLGERFIKKVFDHAIFHKAEEVYVTAFEKHIGLIEIFKRYGFIPTSTKKTNNGLETVYVKSMNKVLTNTSDSYPLVNLIDQNIYLLSLYPKWHTRLLPDSILKTEDTDVIQDISHTNSIHKVYLAAMQGMGKIKTGDIILIYRTSDEKGAAYFRSVATSICVIEEYRPISSFASMDEFIKYCRPYTVFTVNELTSFWKTGQYPHIIRFTYNVALKKRVNRKAMIEECGIDSKAYPGFMQLSQKQFLCITDKGHIDESLIIH